VQHRGEGKGKKRRIEKEQQARERATSQAKDETHLAGRLLEMES
jgi:hypothetical protein